MDIIDEEEINKERKKEEIKKIIERLMIFSNEGYIDLLIIPTMHY